MLDQFLLPRSNLLTGHLLGQWLTKGNFRSALESWKLRTSVGRKVRNQLKNAIQEGAFHFFMMDDLCMCWSFKCYLQMY